MDKERVELDLTSETREQVRIRLWRDSGLGVRNTYGICIKSSSSASLANSGSFSSLSAHVFFTIAFP